MQEEGVPLFIMVVVAACIIAVFIIAGVIIGISVAPALIT
jgi:hypothetical protein